MLHVNPLVSDGSFTIGYDADGVAGQWPGNMAESVESAIFIQAKEGDTFCDGSAEWDAYLDGEELVWRDSVGNWIAPRALLFHYGDR